MQEATPTTVHHQQDKRELKNSVVRTWDVLFLMWCSLYLRYHDLGIWEEITEGSFPVLGITVYVSQKVLCGTLAISDEWLYFLQSAWSRNGGSSNRIVVAGKNIEGRKFYTGGLYAILYPKKFASQYFLSSKSFGCSVNLFCNYVLRSKSELMKGYYLGLFENGLL